VEPVVASSRGWLDRRRGSRSLLGRISNNFVDPKSLESTPTIPSSPSMPLLSRLPRSSRVTPGRCRGRR
jgi:hypothetical protein